MDDPNTVDVGLVELNPVLAPGVVCKIVGDDDVGTTVGPKVGSRVRLLLRPSTCPVSPANTASISIRRISPAIGDISVVVVGVRISKLSPVSL